MNDENDLISTTKMAKRLGVHRMTVVRLVKAGRIPYIKISSTEYRYDADKVLAALEDSTDKDI